MQTICNQAGVVEAPAPKAMRPVGFFVQLGIGWQSLLSIALLIPSFALVMSLHTGAQKGMMSNGVHVSC